MPEQVTDLMASLESAMADVASTLARIAEVAGGAETALVETLSALERNQRMDLAPLVSALAAIRPQINVSVPPAPAPVVHVTAAARFSVTINDAYGRPERTMTIERHPQ